MDTTIVPAGSLVVLVGPPGTGKSSWVHAQVRSGAVRATDVVGRGPGGLSPAQIARISTTLRSGRSVVVDGAHLGTTERSEVLALATRGALAFAVRFTAPLDELLGRNAGRRSPIGEDLLGRLVEHFERRVSVEVLEAEGFRVVEPERQWLALLPADWDGRHLRGAFDVIGDVHGSLETLRRLMARLGYDERGRHPEGRVLVFVGDICDKGRSNLEAMEFVMGLECIEVLSNHPLRLRRLLVEILADLRPEPTDQGLRAALERRAPELRGGLEATVREIAERDDCLDVARALVRYVDSLSDHVVLDGGSLVVCHAGATPDMVGHTPSVGAESRAIQRGFVYGPPSVADPDGGANRHWSEAWDCAATLVHGHSVVSEPRVKGRVVSIDTGCYRGGGLTAFSWPEQRFVTEATAAADLAPSDEAPSDELEFELQGTPA